MRLDKWLQVARFAKTRTQATQACERGRVTVNGQSAKPHKTLAIGDRVEFEQGDWQRIVVVLRLHDKPLPKEQAATLFEDHSPPRPVMDAVDRILRRPPILRDAGAGRPTKRDRRRLEQALDGGAFAPDLTDLTDLTGDDGR